MNITSISNKCGDGICQVGEGVISCAQDCTATFKDYLSCVIRPDNCFNPELGHNAQILTFILALAVTLYYLRKKEII